MNSQETIAENQQVQADGGGVTQIAGQSVSLTNGGALVALANEMKIENGGMIAGFSQEAHFQSGGAGIMMAGVAEVENGNVGVLVAREVTAPSINSFLFVSGSTTGEVHTVIDRQRAILIGAVAGAVMAMIGLLLRGFRR